MSKDDIYDVAYEKFGVIPHQFDTVWGEIHQQNPEVKWNAPGRPRGSRKIPKRISK